MFQSPLQLVLCLWGGVVSWGGVGVAVKNHKKEVSVSVLFASMHVHVNSMHKSVFEAEVVKRFHTLAGSCEQCRHGVRFHPGPISVVLCQCGCGTRTAHLASWVPKARMTNTHVPLTTYPYRSLDSIYSMTLLVLTQSHPQSTHPTHTCTHSTSYIHTDR